MGYNNTLFNLLKNINFENKSIIELGSQDLFIPIEEVNEFIYYFKGIPKNLNKYLSNDYSRLSSEYFYKNIGIKDYTCIDLDGVHNSLKFDLNLDINKVYKFNNTYDIVTNIGTSEHIFNQKSCFENIHNLCNENGLMIHLLPTKGHENHCFFNYHSTLFEHLSEANNYEILYIDFQKTTYYESNDSEHILVVLKKKTSDLFRNPIQNKINQPKIKINNLNNIYIKRFNLLTGFDMNNINNIAIFGTKVAAEEAYFFSKKLDKNVVCFIDDFEKGFYKKTNIPIVNIDCFLKNYQNKVDLVFQGNKQKGNLSKRKVIDIPIFEISSLINY